MVKCLSGWYKLCIIIFSTHGWQPWNVVRVWIFLVIFCIVFHSQHKRFPRKNTAHLSINCFLHNIVMATLVPPPSMLNDQSWNIFCLLNEHDINYYFMHVTECHEAFFFHQLKDTSLNFITSFFTSNLLFFFCHFRSFLIPSIFAELHTDEIIK